MANLDTCMDLIGLSWDFTPQRLRESGSSDDLSCFCMEEAILLSMEDEDMASESVITPARFEPSTRDTDAHIQMDHRTHSREPNPRALHNFRIGSITDLESRNTGAKSPLD